MHHHQVLVIFAMAFFAVSFDNAAFAAAASGEAAGEANTVRRLIDSGCLAQNKSNPSNSEIAAALKACPSIDPVFRVENGFNVSKINRVSADKECRVIATASEDKTARVVRGDGTLLSILRPPIGPANGGKLRSVAVSPDGRIIVAGGWDIALPGAASTRSPGDTSDNGIYVFDPTSGKLLKRIGNFPFDLKTLVFSPDGTRLAATMGNNVFVLATEKFEVLFHDGAVNDIPYGAAFGRDNALYVTSLDGNVRKYDPNGRKVKQVQLKDFGRPYGIAVQPDGMAVAISSIDSPGVTILDTANLKVVGGLDLSELPPAPLVDLAGTNYGSIAAGGAMIDRKTGIGIVRIWGTETEKNWVDVQIANDSVNAIAPCGRGFLIATVMPTLMLVDLQGHTLWRLESRAMKAYLKIGDGFRVSSDGRRVRFGLGSGATDPVEFDIMKERLFRSPQSGDDLFAPIIDLLPVTAWNESGEPRLGNAPLEHQANETFRSMAQQPDGSGFVLGSEFQLWRFDKSGRQLWPGPVKPPAPAYGVNISRDGRLLIAAYGDGTIRWHRLADGAELLALFVDAKTLAWIAWTPSGYFMSSPGGDELGGWHINRGWNQASDFFPMSRFRDRFYRPDVVKLVLATLDENAALAAADAAAMNDGHAAPTLADNLPPVVTIVSPIEGSNFEQSNVTLAYDLRSPSGKDVGSIEALVNGRPVGLRQLPPPGGTETRRGTIDIELPADLSGPIELGLVANAGNTQSSVAKVRLQFTPASSVPSPDELLKPKLFALVVGVSDYKIPNITPLKFAAKDADDFERLLQRQEGGLYGPVKVRKLTNVQATTAAIKEGFAWLDENVTRHDVGIVFLAGHGQTDARNRFWFLTSDADKERLAATALSREDVSVTLQSLRGRVIVFLDACHAGGAGGSEGSVDMNALMSDLGSSGQEMVVFSSSAGRELSYESADWQNGAFTKSVIEAVAEGKADLFKTGRITSSLLDAYAAKRVGALTNDRQHPLMFRPQQAADFEIAIVR
jgi:WD40 repeat protein